MTADQRPFDGALALWCEDALPWLRAALPGDGPVTLEPLVAGHSNIVLGAAREGHRYVVRRPPMGEFAASAHDVLREARLLDTLAAAGFARAPRVIAVATAEPGPAYVMNRLPGVAIRGLQPAWLDTPQRCELVSRGLVGALAELHALPIKPFEDARLGRAEGYLPRQLQRWSYQRDGFVSAGARPLPEEPAVREWLQRRLPAEQASTPVHGDFKLDNVLVDPDSCAITGVLDWEMATLGDPLADLGFLVAFWPDSAASAAVFGELLGDVTLAPGFLDRAGLVEEYASLTNRQLVLSDLRWHVVLALWKMALLLEASYGRYLAGTTDDGFFACLDTAVPRLLAAARDWADCSADR